MRYLPPAHGLPVGDGVDEFSILHFALVEGESSPARTSYLRFGSRTGNRFQGLIYQLLAPGLGWGGVGLGDWVGCWVWRGVGRWGGGVEVRKKELKRKISDLWEKHRTEKNAGMKGEGRVRDKLPGYIWPEL